MDHLLLNAAYRFGLYPIYAFLADEKRFRTILHLRNSGHSVRLEQSIIYVNGSPVDPQLFDSVSQTLRNICP